MNPISWHTEEYNHEKKSADWYWAVGIVAVSAAAASVLMNNVLLAILITIGAFSLMLLASRPPEIIEIKIDESGIIVGKYRYPFSNLESFWINEHTNPPRLLITSKKTFAPHIIILVKDVSVEGLRSRLRERVKEEEQHESLIQLIMEHLGF